MPVEVIAGPWLNSRVPLIGDLSNTVPTAGSVGMTVAHFSGDEYR